MPEPIDLVQDIQSLTSFKRNTNSIVKRIKQTGRPLVLTLNGKAEVVVIDAARFQEMTEQLHSASGKGQTKTKA